MVKRVINIYYEHRSRLANPGEENYPIHPILEGDICDYAYTMGKRDNALF